MRLLRRVLGASVRSGCAILLFISILKAAGAQCGARSSTAYHRLFDNLFENGYNSSVIPRSSTSSVLTRIFYTIYAIHHVDEKVQTVRLLGFMSMRWNDILLQWNETDFENISSIIVPAQRMWIPTMLLIESIQFDAFEKGGEVTVLSDGRVRYYPHSVVEVKCNFDLTYYPFDSHQCRFHIEVWSHTIDDVLIETCILRHRSAEASKLQAEWELILNGENIYTSNTSRVDYSGCQFNFILKRKPILQIFNVLLPIILLSFLNLMAFRLPVESGERISFSITILLAFALWQLMLNNIMPTGTDHIPIIGIYTWAFMAMSSLSLVITIFVIRMSLKPSGTPLPRWAEVIGRLHNRLVLCSCWCSRKKKSQVEPVQMPISWRMVSDGLNDVFFISFMTFTLLSTTILLCILRSQ